MAPIETHETIRLVSNMQILVNFLLYDAVLSPRRHTLKLLITYKEGYMITIHNRMKEAALLTRRQDKLIFENN